MVFSGESDLLEWDECINRLKFLALVVLVCLGIGFWISAWFKTTSLSLATAVPAVQKAPSEIAHVPNPAQL